MRIPSQFGRTSLYPSNDQDSGRPSKRRSAPKAKSSTGILAGLLNGGGATRRVIRMMIALALVLLVMREAGDPAIYQTFFGSDQSNWVEIPVSQSNTNQTGTVTKVAQATPVANSDPATSTGPDTGLATGPDTGLATGPNTGLATGQQTPPATSDQPNHTNRSQPQWLEATNWIESLPVELQKAWIQGLVDLQQQALRSSSQLGPWQGLNEDQIQRSLALLDDLTEDDTSKKRDKISQAIAQRPTSVDQTENSETTTASDASPDSTVNDTTYWQDNQWWIEPMMKALDSAALRRVKDGTVWTGADSDAFYLQLSQAGTLPGDQGDIVGTVQLMHQSATYQGQPIRLEGGIGRARRIPAKRNGLGIENYWEIWMLPSDGGNRPLMLLTPELPASLASGLDADGSWDRSQSLHNPDGLFAATGRLIKRIPYQSAAGPQMAAAVIGRVTATMDDSQKTASESSANDADKGNKPPLLLMIAGCIALGISVAAFLMYRAGNEHKRSRKLRRNSSSESLDGINVLADHIDNRPATTEEAEVDPIEGINDLAKAVDRSSHPPESDSTI